MPKKKSPILKEQNKAIYIHIKNFNTQCQIVCLNLQVCCFTKTGNLAVSGKCLRILKLIDWNKGLRIAQGTLFNVMWQPEWEGPLEENGYMYMCG